MSFEIDPRDGAGKLMDVEIGDQRRKDGFEEGIVRRNRRILFDADETLFLIPAFHASSLLEVFFVIFVIFVFFVVAPNIGYRA